MKKILAILLALVMVMGMATSVFATNVTINNPYYDSTVPQEYEAFQILTASVDEGENNYAYKVNPSYKEVIKQALGMTGEADDQTIIGAIAELDYEPMRHFAGELYDLIMADAALYALATKWSGASTTLAEGYWLIADVSNLEGEHLSNSVVMLDTVGKDDVTVNAKPDVLESHKETDDENDSVADVVGSEDEYYAQEVVDYDIGDVVPFELTAEIPSNATSYKYYSFVMRDRLSKGLTINENSFKVYIGSSEKSLAKAGTADALTADFVYVLESATVDGETGTALYVYPNKSYETYELDTSTDKLDDYVIVNPNKDSGGDYLKLFPSGTDHELINSQNVYFTYTATLNSNAKIGIEGNPNYYDVKFSNDPDGDSFGVTPEDINIVLTYKLDVDKIRKDGSALSGADFTLSKFIALAGIVDADNDADVDDEDIAAAKTAATAALPADVTADKLYNHHSAGAWGYFKVLDNIKSVDDEDNTFTFTGLDDGYYKLEENEVPVGYNGIEPIEFHVVATHVVNRNGDPILKSLDIKTKVIGEAEFTTNVTDGTISTDIVNLTGTELPSTGGVGTTIFYILGSIMVLGAVVVLVTKRRMSAEG